jgi:hypothetical protein
MKHLKMTSKKNSSFNNRIPKNFSIDLLFGENKDKIVDYSHLYQ